MPTQCNSLNLYVLKLSLISYRKLGLDLVPRQGAQMVEPDSMSVVELYHVHLASAENTQGVSVRHIYFILNWNNLELLYLESVNY